MVLTTMPLNDVIFAVISLPAGRSYKGEEETAKEIGEVK